METDPDHFSRLAARRARARARFRAGDDFLMRAVVDETLERLAGIERRFDKALALFGESDYLTDQLAGHERVDTVERLERDACEGDDLGLKPQSLDLVVAPLTLHFGADLPGLFVQIRRALRPDGLFLAALPGPDTLKELRLSLLHGESAATGGAGIRVDAFTDVRDAGGLLQRAGFALPVVDTDTLAVRYDDLFALVRDLRTMGVTRAGPPLRRGAVAAAAAHYAGMFSDPDGRIRASFQIVSLSGWAPHESQQKPLRPGSAKARLSEALGVEEKKL